MRLILVLLLIVLCSAVCLSEQNNNIFDDVLLEKVDVPKLVQNLVYELSDRLKCVHYGLKQSDCVSCLSADRILSLLHLDQAKRSLTKTELESIATVLLHHILFFRSLCPLPSQGCSNYTVCRQEVHDELNSKNPLDSLEDILRWMKSVLDATSTEECFNAEMILNEVRAKDHSSNNEKSSIILSLMKHVFQGRCVDVGESVTDFLDNLFHLYGDKCSTNIDISGLKRIMQDLQTNSIGSHDHDSGDHDHDHSHHNHNHNTPHKDDRKDCNNYFQRLSYSHHEHPDHHSHGDHDHDDHYHSHDHDHDHGHGGDHDLYHHNHSVYELHVNDTHDDHDHNHDANHNITGDRPSNKFSHRANQQDNRSYKQHLVKTNSVSGLNDTDFPVLFPNPGDKNNHSSTNGSKLETVFDSLATVSALRSEFLHHEENADGRNSIHFHTGGHQRHQENLTTESILQEQLDAHHHHGSLASKCFSGEELMSRFGHVSNASLTKQEFLHLCPALVQQIVSGVCQKKIIPEEKKMTDLELYGYSTVAVIIISLTSLAGVVLLPVLAKQAYYYIMAGCIGLAFSTLAGDALLHLIPQAMGIHNHDDETHSHDDDKGFGDPAMWKQAAIFFSIYLLYLFEASVCAFSKTKHSHGDSNGHGHSHIPDTLPKELTLVSIKVKSDSNVQLAMSPERTSLDTEVAENEAPKKHKAAVIDAPKICGLSTVALLVTLGDSIHNFGDGLAIGAAFSSGIRSGLSTAIAVFCHELPHEFGDFVILLSSGLSFSKALWINFLSGLTCLVGLYIGIQIGVNLEARNWILTVTAGIFLYVALTEMLPELKENKNGSPGKMLLVKNIGILAGFAMMILLSVYEHQFNF